MHRLSKSIFISINFKELFIICHISFLWFKLILIMSIGRISVIWLSILGLSLSSKNQIVMNKSSRISILLIVWIITWIDISILVVSLFFHFKFVFFNFWMIPISRLIIITVIIWSISLSITFSITFSISPSNLIIVLLKRRLRKSLSVSYNITNVRFLIDIQGNFFKIIFNFVIVWFEIFFDIFYLIFSGTFIILLFEL